MFVGFICAIRHKKGQKWIFDAAPFLTAKPYDLFNELLKIVGIEISYPGHSVTSPILVWHYVQCRLALSCLYYVLF